MAERLSQSSTFQALEQRVTTLEENGAPDPINADNIEAALGYVPANKTGDTFDGTVSFAGSAQKQVWQGSDNCYLTALNAAGAQQGYLGWNGGVAALNGETYIALNVAGSDRLQASPSGVNVLGGLSVTGAANIGDANFIAEIDIGNPLIGFDPGDYLAYDRASNIFAFNISGTAIMGLASGAMVLANGVTLTVNSKITIGDENLYLDIEGGDPRLNFASDGWFAYVRSDGHFSWVTNGQQRMLLNDSSLHGPGIITAGDSNFGLSLNGGGQPLLAFDSGDYLSYIRGSNVFSFVSGNTTKATIDSSGNLVAYGAILAAADGNFALSIPEGPSKPRLTFDAGDYLNYDRVNNAFEFHVGGALKMTVNAAGVEINGGPLSVAGAVYPAADNNFRLDKLGDDPTIAFDVGDTISYSRAGDTLNFNIDNAVKFSLTGSTATAFGNLLATGDVVAGNDTNFRLTLTGSQFPHLLFDVNDYLEFDRGSNLFNFVIGGSAVFTIGNTGGITTPSVVTTGSSGFLCAPDTANNKGGITMCPATVAGQTGRLVLYDGTGSQHSAIGPCTNAGAMGFISNNGAGFNFFGGAVTFQDQNFAADYNSGSPRIQFDSGDYFRYDRTANKLYFYVGNTAVMSVDGSGNMKIKGTLTQGAATV